MAVIYLMY